MAVFPTPGSPIKQGLHLHQQKQQHHPIRESEAQERRSNVVVVGIVLGATRKNLDRATNLLGSTNDWIELAILCELGEVASVLGEGAGTLHLEATLRRPRQGASPNGHVRPLRGEARRRQSGDGA